MAAVLRKTIVNLLHSESSGLEGFFQMIRISNYRDIDIDMYLPTHKKCLIKKLDVM